MKTLNLLTNYFYSQSINKTAQIPNFPARNNNISFGNKDNGDQFVNSNYDKKISGKTQISGTVITYEKLKNYLQGRFKNYDKLAKLDYGAGLGLGAKVLGSETFEPFADKWSPDYTKPDQIKKKYDLITCMHVVNVIEDKKDRDKVVKHIGELLNQNGEAYFATRSKNDVDSTKKATKHKDGILTGIGTFQKGFTQAEFNDYIKDTLGNSFEVTPFKEIKNHAIMVRVKKIADTTQIPQLAEAESKNTKYHIPQRDKEFGVGKRMAEGFYVHKQYENVLPQEEMKKAKSALPEDFDYTIVKYNHKNGNFTFTHSPDWNTADEPIVGDAYLIKAGEKPKKIVQQQDPWIYHHKWNFVKDDYKGFDVEKSKERSNFWSSLPIDIDSSRIGKKSYWQKNVLDYISSTKN